MTNLLDLLTFEWFLPKALIGLSVGFVLRVLEHYAWLKRENRNERLFFWNSRSYSINLRWVASCLCFVSLPDSQLSEHRFYYCCMLPTLAVFIAVDLRQLLRRIYSKSEH